MEHNIKEKISMKLYANIDTSDIDRAIEKVIYLTNRIQELKASVNELNSCIEDIKLKVNIQS